MATVLLTVDFPLELQEKRKVWAKLRLAETSIDFPWTEGDLAGRYRLNVFTEDDIFLGDAQRLELELVQDRGWISRNRSFSGNTQFDVFKTLAEGSGLILEALISPTIPSDNGQQPVPRIIVNLNLSGVALPTHQTPEPCMQ